MVEVDHHLRSQVDQLKGMVAQLNANVGQVSGQVTGVATTQQQTRSELGELRSAFDEYVQQAVRTANLQRAETVKGTLQDELQHEFGGYEKVRKTASGLLWAFDSGLVRQESVENATDLLMIENPRYWLAPVTVGLGAWSGNDSVLCDQAIAAAYQLAPTRTSLMFSLILRRQGRQQSSVRWLRHYLSNLDPMALSREFAVVLESVAQGAFGAGGRALIRENVDSWLAKLEDDEAVQDNQVKRWRFEIERYMPAGAGDAFPRLRAHSPQWPQLEAVLRGAEAHQPFHEHYNALLAAEYTPTDRLEDSIDDILDILVSEYDNEELPRRRDLARQQAIIDHEGDLDKAKAAADASAASLGATIDYLTIQTTAALDPGAIGVTPATQQVALATCAPWVGRAHGSFCMDYRRAYPANVDVVFSETHPFGKTVFTLPTWTGSLTTTPMPQLEQSLAAHWDAAAAPLLASLVFNLGKALIAPILVSVFVLLVLVAANPIVAVLIGGAVFGIWFATVKSKQSKAEAFRKQVADALEAQKQAALADLRGAGAEHTDYQSRFRAGDAKEQQVRELIESFAQLGQDKTPYDRRALTTEGNLV